MDEAKSPTVWFALGSNIDDHQGDRVAHLCFARAQLQTLAAPRSFAASSLFETAPVGPVQPPYLNAVIKLSSQLPPAQLLAYAHQIEAARLRQRSEHWGPRTLDVDLLMVNDWRQGEQSDATRDDALMRISTNKLVLPHPRIEERVFVLAPWNELSPHWMLPSGLSVAERLGWLLKNQPAHLQPVIYKDSRWAGAASGTINNLR